MERPCAESSDFARAGPAIPSGAGEFATRVMYHMRFQTGNRPALHDAGAAAAVPDTHPAHPPGSLS
ncbi:hypothetical protein CBM2633_A40095 [Cupriavidus taiwanensis]|nr:hypothetical protein CBM2633_A40095 [Cupriavidus taiwanensis]